METVRSPLFPHLFALSHLQIISAWAWVAVSVREQNILKEGGWAIITEDEMIYATDSEDINLECKLYKTACV